MVKNVKNERSFQSNDVLRTKTMEVILEIPISIDYILNMNKGCSQNDYYIFLIDNIVERLKVISIGQFL